jgi:hypothetical protein
MAADHPRSGVTHDLPDLFAHFRLVTMDGTIGADGLFPAEGAGNSPFLGISEQFIAIGAKIIFSVMIPAVNSDHLMEGLDFSMARISHLLRSRDPWSG